MPISTSRRPRRSASRRFHGRSDRFTRRPQRRKVQQPSFDPTRFINTNPVDLVQEVYTPEHRFTDFQLDEQLQKNISFNKLTSPSPIQDQAIPFLLQGRDLIGLAATGTGKTAAFLIPLIERTLHRHTGQTLILTPTRELAIQVESEFRKLARGLGLKSVTCVGGMAIRPQIQTLRRHNHFIIGTPGRIMDLIDRGNIRPHKMTAVVLDEADRMLDMGFINDMRSILTMVPKERHTLFFSATMNDTARRLTEEFLNNPEYVSVKTKDVTDSIAQDVVKYFPDKKLDTLVTLLGGPAYQRVIVFGAMKRGVETLTKQLRQAGIKAESIHGDKTHGQRQRALQNFKDGYATVLVATDVAARGIHVDNVTHVINYDLPNTFEDYVHRIGRTGRGTKRGQALTFIPHSNT